MSIHAEDSAYALLSDGATIEIRAARPGDFDAVRDMHAKIGPHRGAARLLRRAGTAMERRHGHGALSCVIVQTCQG